MLTFGTPLPRCAEPVDWVGHAGSELDWVSGVPVAPRRSTAVFSDGSERPSNGF
jgi:hypothetical protein